MRFFSALLSKCLHFTALTLFYILGWKVQGSLPADKKQVIIAAPHTSAWDYLVMIGASWYYEVKISWLGKKELFHFWPLNILFKITGGIPIDRTKNNNLVNILAKKIRSADSIYLCIPPEGSRDKKSGWKSGFYYIALTAQVPITCSFIDYANKTTGFGISITPSGDIKQDMQIIAKFYENIEGKYPLLQNPIKIEQSIK